MKAGCGERVTFSAVQCDLVAKLFMPARGFWSINYQMIGSLVKKRDRAAEKI